MHRTFTKAWPWMRFGYSFVTVGVTFFFFVWALLAAQEEAVKNEHCNFNDDKSESGSKSSKVDPELLHACLDVQFSSVSVRLVIALIFLALALFLSVEAFYVRLNFTLFFFFLTVVYLVCPRS